MAKLSPLVLAPPLIFAALAAVFYVGMFRDAPNALPSSRVGGAAPALALEPFSGPVPTDADLRGGAVTLVNYWASWCAPCRAEHPQLEALADEGHQLLGINYKDDPARAAAFLNELGNPFTIIGADTGGRSALEWGVYGVPETYVVAGDGTVILRFAGPITPELLDSQIRPAIAEAKARK